MDTSEKVTFATSGDGWAGSRVTDVIFALNEPACCDLACAVRSGRKDEPCCSTFAAAAGVVCPEKNAWYACVIAADSAAGTGVDDPLEAPEVRGEDAGADVPLELHAAPTVASTAIANHNDFIAPPQLTSSKAFESRLVNPINKVADPQRPSLACIHHARPRAIETKGGVPK